MPDRLRDQRLLYVGTTPSQPRFKNKDELLMEAITRDLAAKELPAPPGLAEPTPTQLDRRGFVAPVSRMAQMLMSRNVSPEKAAQLLEKFDRGLKDDSLPEGSTLK